jgi:hypothetical protein
MKNVSVISVDTMIAEIGGIIVELATGFKAAGCKGNQALDESAKALGISASRAKSFRYGAVYSTDAEEYNRILERRHAALLSIADWHRASASAYADRALRAEVSIATNYIRNRNASTNRNVSALAGQSHGATDSRCQPNYAAA